MGDALIIAGIAIGSALVPITSVGLIRWRLRRRLRVSRRAPSSAPLIWLVSPTTPARLHRRLRDATALARLVHHDHPGGAVDDIVHEIERQALALERHLVLATRLRRGYGPFRRTVAAQIAQLETLATRLAHVAVERDRLSALPAERTEPLARIAERLDALDAARAELAGIELDAGLNRTGDALTPPPAPPPPPPPLRR